MVHLVGFTIEIYTYVSPKNKYLCYFQNKSRELYHNSISHALKCVMKLYIILTFLNLGIRWR